jgi:hypothetical protein
MDFMDVIHYCFAAYPISFFCFCFVVVVVQQLELRRKEWASEISTYSWVLRKYPVSQVRLIVVRIAAPHHVDTCRLRWGSFEPAS